MAKKLFPTIQACCDCPYAIASTNPNIGMCKITGQQVYLTDLSYDCPLSDEEE